MTRFRRTKDELARGLSPEQAKAERDAFKTTLATAAMPPMTADEAQKAYDEAEPVPLKKKIVRKGSGEIVVRIRPAKGVDADYFEHLRDGVITVEQDEHFYKWFDHLASKVYDEQGQPKLMTDILSEGIGGVLTTRQKPGDVK